jgi:hypothetical protein
MLFSLPAVGYAVYVGLDLTGTLPTKTFPFQEYLKRKHYIITVWGQYGDYE